MDDNKFHGKPCVRCGGTLRYKTRPNKSCVACQMENGRKQGRKRSDLKLYGTTVDNEKVARRRAAEELLLERELSL